MNQPLLRVVRGTPDDVELAALTAVVAALPPPAADDGAEPRRSAWSDPSARLRTQLPHGPGAWRSSGFPR
ncbi:acyl-CoA carboxylase subunit epsilon [Actinocrispum wychmicini]|uniref:Acyl-CoA carboxylase epsilon subunit-like protein n=1 Tax=Actinocrispum wychmicini TaxID=1213861 RepID=A0A4R2K1N0_9PSEU|nr:acyl-CoA carboxylase subunit epsilon [Actinocrispum wychmicini]TCO65617.1 acyl-CoA carboxylase epsilon subunit-like protein [Actinocrispum wychmicini]